MRRLERIPEVLDELEKIWKKMPDLRFGQFLWIVFQNGEIPFYMEDDEFIKLLGKVHKTKVKKIKVFEKGKYAW